MLYFAGGDCDRNMKKIWLMCFFVWPTHVVFFLKIFLCDVVFDAFERFYLTGVPWGVAAPRGQVEHMHHLNLTLFEFLPHHCRSLEVCCQLANAIDGRSQQK